MNKIEFDVSHEEIQDLFDVVEFLERNKDVIIQDITPSVTQYLDNSNVFNGPFRRVYDESFNDFIIDRLKDVISDNLKLNVEQVNVLVDRDMFELLGVLDLFANKELYNGQH